MEVTLSDVRVDAPREHGVVLARPTASSDEPILKVDGLKTYFFTRQGVVKAVDGVSFEVKSGETLAIVGESGCGKSMTALSILRLVAESGRVVEGTVMLEGRDILKISENEMRGVRGNKISMIFQEPMTSLNPLLTIGQQISEVIRLHQKASRSEAMERSEEMLRLVKIAEPKRRLNEYPHQLSGGMRQRAMIAMALACNPRVLLADEPTTALDVTVQAQITQLIVDLQQRLGTAVVLITHDLGVVAESANYVVVMYAGRKVEEAPVSELFSRPRHPYTAGLLAAIPSISLGGDSRRGKLKEIPGIVPALSNLPPGCTFAPRCAYASELCHSEFPPYELKQGAHWAACWHSEKIGRDA